MAKKTVPAPASAISRVEVKALPAPNPGRDALIDLSNEVSAPLSQLIGLVDLMIWIEGARNTEAKLHNFSRCIPALKEQLEMYGITDVGSWDNDESSGFTMLHWAVRDLLMKVSGDLDRAVEGTTPAEGQPHG